MLTYSHSRISCFETCRLQFKYKYIDKVATEQEATAETFLGSLVHEALHRLYKDLQHEKRRTKEELVAWFNEEWARRWDDKAIKVVSAEYSPENYRDMGARFIADYYGQHAPFDATKTIGLETEEKLVLDGNHDYHVRIDRLAYAGDGTYEVHDYKTNSHLKTQDELEADRQLAMYAYWVHRAFPDAKRIRLVWHFLAFGKEMVVEKAIGDLERLREDVLARIAEIESTTEFPARQSALCDWCAYHDACPVWKHLAETERLALEEFKKEDGVRLAEEYGELKERESEIKAHLEELQARIYAYAAQHKVQAIYGPLTKVSVWSKETVKLPGKNDPSYAELVRLVKEQGLFEEFSMLDSWKLQDALGSGKARVQGFEPAKEKVRRLYVSRR